MLHVDRVLDVRRAACQRVGGVGDRYTCRINGRETYLWLEKGVWFVEAEGRSGRSGIFRHAPMALHPQRLWQVSQRFLSVLTLPSTRSVRTVRMKTRRWYGCHSKKARPWN